MSVLFPHGAWLLLVPASVIALHFLRMPRRRVVVSDLAPWLTVARAGRRISSERRAMISLLLQLIIAFALILAFVKPYFAGVDGGRMDVVLIDVSRSTRARDGTVFKVLKGVEQTVSSGPSRLDLEKRALLSMVRAMNPEDRMTVVAMGAHPAIVANGESEPAMLERAVSMLEARAETAAIEAACRRAVELCKAEKNVRVTVISDGSVDAADFAALNALPDGVGRIRFLTVGAPADNIGITSFRSRKKFNSDEIETTVTVLSSARTKVQVPVELYLDNKIQRAALAELAPGETRVVTFSMDYRRGGMLKARLAIQDALADDNEALDFLPAPRRMKVALVTREAMDEKSANAYYLARVLRSDTGIEGGFLSSADYERIARDKNALKSEFEALIFDNWAPPAETLPPCHALFINAETPEIPVTVKSVLGDKPLIRKWDEGHPLMNYLNLRDVFLKKAKELQLADAAQRAGQDGADVVAELTSSPLILAREIGARKLVYVGFNPADSDIQFKKELPLLVLNCFEWFKRGAEPVTQIAPGEPMLIGVADSTWKSVAVQTPAGGQERIAVPAGAKSVMFFNTTAPGIYRYAGDTEQGAAFVRGFAVNFGSARESNLSVAPAIEIGTADERGRIVNNRAEAIAAESLVEHRVSAGMWAYFAALALAALAVENYFFHRRMFF